MNEKKLCHFFYTPFTGLGNFNGFRGDKWLKNRIQIFKQFVLPSLLNQSNRNFILWISWRPEEKDNPIVQDFYENLSGVRDIKVVFTYYGVCFYDDKYSSVEARAKLVRSLANTLPELKEIVGDAEWVLMTIQPSDDIYSSFVVSDIQNTFQAKRTVGFREGYIMDYASKEVAEYNPDTIPPFFTIMFPRNIFLDLTRHFNFIGPYNSHENIKDVMQFDSFEKRAFVVGTHGDNISTVYNSPFKGRVLNLQEQERVLITSGIYWSDPFYIRKGMRLVTRKVFNTLPFQDRMRKFYHTLSPKWQIF